MQYKMLGVTGNMITMSNSCLIIVQNIHTEYNEIKIVLKLLIVNEVLRHVVQYHWKLAAFCECKHFLILSI